MTVSAISSGATVLPPSPFQQERASFNQLQQSLSSGDLGGAQQAFASLQQLPQKAKAQRGSQSGGNGTLQNDFNALGQALQSGDVTAARKAFATLQQDLQSLRPGHHRHHHTQAAGNNSPTNGTTNGVPDVDGDGSATAAGNNGSSINVSVSVTSTMIDITA